MAEPLVYLALPRRDSAIDWDIADTFFKRTTRRLKCSCAVTQNSLLCHSFNQHWAAALSAPEATHFAMQHADILPEWYWLDNLFDELLDCGADLLSVVVPIKSDEGLTSTAVGTDDPWDSRRLTMHEVYELPETFSSADVGGPLLVNTGLWMCKLGDWCKDFHFDMGNRIVETPEGYRAQVIPEDWLMSQRLHEMGVNVMATRKVLCRHMADRRVYSNERPWGLWKTDERHVERHAVEV